MTTTLRTEGIVTLLSSLSHGGEHAGTAQFLRREKIVQPDGTVEEVPVISGNGLRGVFRDFSARLTWESLGSPPLTTAVFHALWSGGTLAKAGSGGVLSSHQLRRLRELVPHVSLFGCAGGGRIIEGKLMVGKLMPVCTQTAHVLPLEIAAGPLPDVWDLLQMEEFSRVDDAKRMSNPAVALPAMPATEQGALAVIDPPAEVAEVVQQMRYGVETMATGTRLHWWVALRNVSDLELEQFRADLAAWGESGAHVGGRSATGHGRLHLGMEGWTHGAPALTAGSALPGSTADLSGHLRSHASEVVEALGWLG